MAAGAPVGRVKWEHRGLLVAGGGCWVHPGGRRARSGTSSHHKEPGAARGVTLPQGAGLVLRYVPFLEDDLPLPGRQLCLIVPKSP